jgi:hypothetical protein
MRLNRWKIASVNGKLQKTRVVGNSVEVKELNWFERVLNKS